MILHLAKLEVRLQVDELGLKVVDEERSCFTYTLDLAKATRVLVEDSFPFGIYHIVNENPVTWFEGVKKLFEIVGIRAVRVVPIKSKELLWPAKRPLTSVLLNTKFPKLRSYEEALEEYYQGYRNF